ncbi:hypothetical protein ACQ4PT_000102 [Festuca glaucescens]
MEGDVRMHGKSAILYVVAASHDSYRPENGTAVTICPYPRKGELPTMQKIREVTIRPVATAPALPRCTATHDVPAVVFSTGGFSSNAFHVMADIFIPLYNTAREYDGRVQLVATDYDRKWVSKYRHLLAALSVYPVIDFDTNDVVRCFPSARVGIDSHKDLGIIPAMSRNGYTMMGFQGFLRSAYSLKRAWATPVNRSSGARPRLIMIPRGETRALTNEADVIAAAREVGFEVVTVGLEVVSDLARFSEVVNQCDVLVGVHGAGLTNFVFLPRASPREGQGPAVFLPRGATVVQILPWGELKWMSWSDYRDPLADMGLRYAEYEVTAEETTLKEVYPRDHAVFTDPLSIHKQGFDMVWSIFLGQNLTLDTNRFTGVMQQVYQSITIT